MALRCINIGSLCAQHCLNSLLQGDYFTAVDLATIANDLDNIERTFMSEAGTTTQDYEKFLTQESSNYDDTGFFSIQVLQKSLASWNLELIPFTSQNEYAQNARLNPIDEQAFICNFKHHWYSIRKIASYWFNLNSLLKRPELISDTYLSVLLAQLQSDGYAIFIVKGDLPKTQAESKLAENPLNVKEILSSYNKKRNKISSNSSADVFDDDELKKAIKMSLIENDLDLDNTRFSNKLYTSLAHEQPQTSGYGFRDKIKMDDNQEGDEDDEEIQLKKAIEMSMQKEANDNTQLSAPESNPEEIRRKRLEFLDKKQNN